MVGPFGVGLLREIPLLPIQRIKRLLVGVLPFDPTVVGAAQNKVRSRGDKRQMVRYPVARGCSQETFDAPTAMVGLIAVNSKGTSVIELAGYFAPQADVSRNRRFPDCGLGR